MTVTRITGPGVWKKKMLLPEYQSFNIESCLVLFPIWSSGFSNLPAFNRSFLLVKMREFLQKSPFENVQKWMKTRSKISLCSPCQQQSHLELFMYFVLFKKRNPPDLVLRTKERTFHSPKMTARAKACYSHGCEASISRELAINFSKFFNGSRRELF